MKPTYDAIQMAAVLMRCTVCGKDWYMTKPQPVCVRCRHEAEHREGR
jgi:uncharacterized membrane protein